jgi:hypothetical protein
MARQSACCDVVATERPFAMAMRLEHWTSYLFPGMAVSVDISLIWRALCFQGHLLPSTVRLQQVGVIPFCCR